MPSLMADSSKDAAGPARSPASSAAACCRYNGTPVFASFRGCLLFPQAALPSREAQVVALRTTPVLGFLSLNPTLYCSRGQCQHTEGDNSYSANQNTPCMRFRMGLKSPTLRSRQVLPKVRTDVQIEWSSRWLVVKILLLLLHGSRLCYIYGPAKPLRGPRADQPLLWPPRKGSRPHPA